MVVAVNRQVFAARLQVLSDGQNVQAESCQVAHYFLDFVHRLAQARHNPRFGQHIGIHLFGISLEWFLSIRNYPAAELF